MFHKTARLALVTAVLVLFVLATAVASASPSAVTFDTITSSCGYDSPRPDSDVAVAITAENVGGDGAAGYEIELEFDHSQLTLDAVTAGSSMTAMNCNFNTQVGFESPPYSWVTGSCPSAVPNPAAIGNIELVVAHFSFVGAAGPYTIQLTTTGVGVPTALLDRTGAATVATAQQLISCVPTAVTMSGFDATTNSAAPFAAAAWPLLAGAAAVAAGGAYALLRRKS
jgi:hypothetical protein